MTVTRTIKTRLAIEGESEYQAKLQQCNAAIRETASELDLVTAKYADNANSMEALTEKGDVLQKMYDEQQKKVQAAADALENARKAQEDHAKAVEDTRDKLTDAEKRLQEYADAGEDTAEAQKALNKEIEDLRNQLSNSEAMYDAATRGVSKWQIEVNKAEAAMYKTGDALRKNNEALRDVNDATEEASDAMDDMAEEFDLSSLSVGGLIDKVKGINPVVGVAVTALGGAGKAAYDMAEQYQDAASIIGKATGAIGNDLYALTDTAYRAAGKVDATLEDVAAAVGEINTRFGLVGEDLENLTTVFADFADINNTDMVGAVQNVSKIMRNYGEETENAGRVMDMLTVAAQKSGISFGALSSQLINGKAQFVEFGYTLEESIALIAMTELEGLNLNSVLAGFRTAATEAAKAGKDLPRMLDDTIEAIEDAATEQEALNIATEAFGTRAAQEMLLAIRSGRFELDEWVTALEESEGAVEQTGVATDTFADKWQQMKNSVTAGVVELKDEFQRLSGATADALTGSDDMLEETVRNYDEQTAHIDASVVVVERYVKRLKELEEQGLNTAEQQEEYNQLIAQINTLMPDLNLQISEQTGLLEGGTTALLDNIAAWKEYAKQQAQTDYVEGLKTSYTEALAEENRLRNDRANLLLKEAEAQARYDAEYAKYADEIAAMNEEIEKDANSARKYASRIQQINAALAPFQDELEDVKDELKDVDDALETAGETVKDAEEAIDALGESFSEVNDALSESDGIKQAEAELERYADTMTTTSETGIAALKQLQAEYDEAYSAAYASIDAQIGKWKEYAEITSSQAQKAAENIEIALDSQIRFLEEYTKNLDDLMSRDIEGVDVLAKMLADGSEESAAILEGLTDKTDEEVQNIVEKLGDVEEGKEDFAEQIAMLETDYADRMQAIEDETKTTIDVILDKMDSAEEAYTAGLATGEGFNQGLREKLEEARALAAEYQSLMSSMNAAEAELKDTKGAEQHSHANGLYSVPYDEYPALLHKGERVLTAAEARLYNEQEKTGGTNNSRTVNVGGITINGDADRKTIRTVERTIRKAVR